MFSKKLIIGLILLVAIGLAIGTYLVRTNHKNVNKIQPNKKVEASSSQAVLITQPDWEAGTLNNIDSTSSTGLIKINDKSLSEGQLSLTNLYNEDNSRVTATMFESDKANPVDSNLSTSWGGATTSAFSWQMNLGSSYNIIQFNCYDVTAGGPFGFNLYLSSNGSDWTSVGACPLNPGSWYNNEFSPAKTGQYIKLERIEHPLGWNTAVSELAIYKKSPVTATHTSSPTQIGDVSSDPGRYVVEYNGFDTTETEPANTAIDYRFQLVNSSGVSTDGWTAWALGDVADLATTYPSQLILSQTKIDAGETYLQVQSRLTTTDGVSTPTLSDYTASYHTNKAPNTPTPQ